MCDTVNQYYVKEGVKLYQEGFLITFSFRLCFVNTNFGKSCKFMHMLISSPKGIHVLTQSYE